MNEQHFECHRTALLLKRTDSTLLEIHYKESKPFVPIFKESNSYLRKLTAPGSKQATHDGGEQRSERRKEPRIEINHEVTITLLGVLDSRPFQAVAEDMSGSGMRVLCQRPIPYRAMVKVEMRDLLLLGEVIRVQVGDCDNIVALKFWHSLDPESCPQMVRTFKRDRQQTGQGAYPMIGVPC